MILCLANVRRVARDFVQKNLRTFQGVSRIFLKLKDTKNILEKVLQENIG